MTQKPSSPNAKPSALEFDHPLKEPIEYWLLLSASLHEVENALALLINQFNETRKLGEVAEIQSEALEMFRPLYCFSIITYIRCFSGGRRQPLQITDIPRLTLRDLQIHDTVRLLRNRHFAHAVADEERAHIIAIPPQAGIKAGFHILNTTLAGLNKKIYEHF